jgi:hypothetical protein
MHVIVHIFLEVSKFFATLSHEPHQTLLQPFIVHPIDHGLSGFMLHLNKAMCLKYLKRLLGLPRESILSSVLRHLGFLGPDHLVCLQEFHPVFLEVQVVNLISDGVILTFLHAREVVNLEAG